MYIYKTTFLINGKIYIGQCVRSVSSTQWYLGSGTKILDCINSYGNFCFEKEILRICETQKELDIWEMIYISKYKSTNPEIGYNILKGTAQGGDLGTGHVMRIKEVVEKQKASRKAYFESDRSKEHKRKCAERLLGNTFMVGRKMSAKTKLKLRNAHLEKTVNQKTKDKIRTSMIKLRATKFWSTKK